MTEERSCSPLSLALRAAALALRAEADEFELVPADDEAAIIAYALAVDLDRRLHRLGGDIRHAAAASALCLLRTACSHLLAMMLN